MDDELIPRLRDSMRDSKKLTGPKAIATARNKKVSATATGTIWRYIIYQGEHRVPVRMPAMIVPGLGRDPFSVKAMSSRVCTILATGDSPIVQQQHFAFVEPAP